MIAYPAMDKKIFLSLFITSLTVSLGLSIIAPLLPVYAQELGAGGFEIGLIFASFSLARSLMLPFVGNLADRWGRRFFILSGCAIFIFVTFLYDMADSVAGLVFCRLAQGVAGAMVIPVARAYVGDMAPKGEEGRLMGNFNIAFFAGLAIGPWLGGFLYDFFGIRTAIYSMGVMALAGLVFAWGNIPKLEIRKAATGHKISYREMLAAPPLAALFIFRFGTSIGVGLNWAFMPILGHNVFHISAGMIGFLISLNVVMTTALQPLFGRMADRVNRVRMTCAGGIAASLGLILMPYCQNVIQLFFANLIVGISIGFYNPPLMAIGVDHGRETGYMTKVMSFLELSFSMGMVTGPLLGGLVEELSGLPFIFVTGGGIGIAASLFLVVINSLRSDRATAEKPEPDKIGIQQQQMED